MGRGRSRCRWRKRRRWRRKKVTRKKGRITFSWRLNEKKL